MCDTFWRWRICFAIVTVVGMVFAVSNLALAAPPVVKTVPWVATNPLIPHDTWSGKTITLKGTSDVQGSNIQYTWDFGDGSSVATGAVTDRYVIQTTHTYTGTTGTIFTARLMVKDTATNETGSKEYYVKIQDKTLPVEVNVAIDEGLWYLHKTQIRTTESGVAFGDWMSCSSYGCNASLGYDGNTAANVNAFEVNGHLEGGSADNPYVETVQRGMRRLFQFLVSGSIPNSQTNGIGQFNPDTNGNGLGVYVNQSYQFYQGGMLIDAIVASGTPNAIATTGLANVVNRQYKDIVQDMVDAYSYCQYDLAGGGGWRYNCNEFPDNSVGQWAAIGLIAAERLWGTVVPSTVKDWNKVWLTYTQAGDGSFGYTSASPIWGPYATTPSGMVQMAMDGIGRGNGGSPRWDSAETFMRDHFIETSSYATSVKDYYYGLFSFTKSMLLHDSNGDGIAEPIALLRSSTAGVNPIDWYGAERVGSTDTINDTNGVARLLVKDQNPAGDWYCHDADGSQCKFETAWAITMLNRTVIEPVPIAVADAVPNPSLVGNTVTLDGTRSFHQDPARKIVLYEWDLDNDGTYDKTGSVITYVFPVSSPPPPPPNVTFPVKLRVTDDNASPKTSVPTTINVIVSTPPVAPTASANGPYVFCIGATPTPWRLDGTRSVNPDDGIGEPNAPGDRIIEYAWDVNGDNVFDDFLASQPDVTALYTGLGVGDYLVQLRVTDNTLLSFPSSGQPNLTDVDSAEVRVRLSGDPLCVTKPIPPGITPAISGTLGNNGWYISNVTVSWAVVDNGYPIISQQGCDPTTVTTDTAEVTFTCVATNSGGTTSNSVTIKRDATPPTITGSASPAANATGWNNSAVTVSFTCSDAVSGIATCTDPQLLGEGANQPVSGTATDKAGNSADTQITGINIDLTAPAVQVTGVTNGATYVLGSVPAAGCATTDALSGVQTNAILGLVGGNSNGVGTFTASCTGATDKAGNVGAASVTYKVTYSYSGFFPPVDGSPTINAMKAGAAVPIKFSLGGNFGLAILAMGSPISQAMPTCGGPIDDIEQTVTAGNSGLSYDATTNQYTYVWKTNNVWAGTCRQFILTLNDGTAHVANFQFK